MTLASFESWLARGFAGEMSYLADRHEAYAHPAGVLPGVKSVKAVGLKNADTFRGPKFIGADKIWDGTAVPW